MRGYGLARLYRNALHRINGDHGFLVRTVLPNEGTALPFLLLVFLPVVEQLDKGIDSRFANLPGSGVQFIIVNINLKYVNTSSISFFSSSTGDT
jgi:hypothetical protein